MYVKDIISLITPEIRKEMESIWFTADLHHDHPKIVNICNRPVYLDQPFMDALKNKYKDDDPGYNIYNDAEYKKRINPVHNDWLIKEVFNKWVKRKDIVFILGDLSLGKRKEADKFIDRLNGNKFLISGNHDGNIITSTRFSQVTPIKEYVFKRGKLNINISLCHYPLASWNKKPHGAWNLYGHVHGRFKNPGLSLDVGIDNVEVDFRPINLYEVTLIMLQKEEKLGLGVYFDNGVD